MRKIVVTIVVMLGLMISGCGQQIEKGTKDREEIPKTETTAPFIYLHQWKPYNMSNGFGADILLQQDLSEQELVAFIQQLADNHNPVIIRVWTSRKAYQDEYAETPEFKTDYLLYYVKNMTSRRPYCGCNEIRWMQEKGKFSSLYGTQTKF